MSKFPPTLEQVAIVEAGTQSDKSLMIKAYAGCGKTSTLELLARAMPVRPTLCLAFNVKNKKDMESRLPSHFEVKTMNGLGHAAFCKTIGKRAAVDPDKVYKITKQWFKDQQIQNTSEDTSTVMALVRRARVAGLVPQAYEHNYRGLVPDNGDGWEGIADSLYMDLTEMQVLAARDILTLCVKQSFGGVIDYDDQIYMSALFGGVFPKFPVVMVDEAQDLSPLNHIQVQKASPGRLIVVGDPRQAIYAFRGADSASMDKLRSLRSEWIDLTLSTTFRCPKAVVARQQNHAEGFNAASAAPEGATLDLRGKDWSIPEGEVAILCRNNAPILSCAIKLIKRGIGVTVLGGDIGKSLITFARKLFPDGRTPVEECIQITNDWMQTEVSKAIANDKQERVAVIHDRGECILAILGSSECKTAADVSRILTKIFDSTSLRVTLSTGHKSKGMEWKTVIHLDPWRIPSKYAYAQHREGNSAPLEQDLNLKYVIETRTQTTFIEANLEEMT